MEAAEKCRSQDEAIEIKSSLLSDIRSTAELGEPLHGLGSST